MGVRPVVLAVYALFDLEVTVTKPQRVNHNAKRLATITMRNDLRQVTACSLTKAHCSNSVFREKQCHINTKTKRLDNDGSVVIISSVSFQFCAA